MSPNYRYSILIPAYNGEAFLREALYSAVRQTRKADEIIVVDDGSTDNTADLAQSSEFKKDVQYYYHEKGNGFVEAWNQAIQKATGDFIILLHQDDLLDLEYLAVIDKARQRYPNVRHFYTACNYIDETGEVTRLPIGPYSLDPVLYSGRQYAHNYLNGIIQNKYIHRCPGVTTNRELLLNECTYRKEAGHIADDDFFLRVGAFTDVVGISQPLASYRHHSGSETGRLDLLSLKLAEAYIFQVKYYKDGSSILDPEDIEKINRQAVRFINLLLFQGLLFKRENWIERALELRTELDRVLPDFMERYLPRWARPLWKFMSNRGRRHLTASLYVQFLHSMRQMRDFGRSLIRRGQYYRCKQHRDKGC